MTEIIRAENSGFCFGVKQAIEKTEKQIENNSEGKKIYTCGPLIHNKLVTDDLEARGVSILTNIEDATEDDILIVRSHGEGKPFWEAVKDRNLSVVDATCPFVSKIHSLVADATAEGYNVVIIGDKDHPEVKGINGWSDNLATIINSAEEADSLEADNLFVVCQTTIKKELVDSIVDIFC